MTFCNHCLWVEELQQTWKSCHRSSLARARPQDWLCQSHAQPFATPCTITCQAPVSTGFPRQEYWSGLPFPSPGDLPDPGMETKSPVLAVAEPPQKPAPLLSEAQILNMNKMLSNSNERKYLSHFQGDGVKIYVYIYIYIISWDIWTEFGRFPYLETR